jgi:hypothetical protein
MEHHQLCPLNLAFPAAIDFGPPNSLRHSGGRPKGRHPESSALIGLRLDSGFALARAPE